MNMCIKTLSKHYIVNNAFLPPPITFREIHYRRYNTTLLLSHSSSFSLFVSCFNTPVLLALHLGELD